MPPNSPKIPDAEMAVIRQWIEGGALETSGSVGGGEGEAEVRVQARPVRRMGKPVGPPAMPEKLSTEPVVVSPRAERGRGHGRQPLGPAGRGRRAQAGPALPDHRQPPGRRACRSLRARSTSSSSAATGRCLLAGGGRGGQSGLAVVWDVKTGKRVFEIGKEYDVVLAADISPDHGQVALGGPSKVVRVYNTADGQLQFEMKKHTEWITAVEFSPDGVLLATRRPQQRPGRLGGPDRPRVLRPPRPHRARSPTSPGGSTRTSLASASEDGTVRLWEMENGNQIKNWGAHGGGVASVRFAKDGRLVTTGRDRWSRVWDQNGGKQRDFEAVRRPGPRCRLHLRRRPRRSPATGRARSASSTPRTVKPLANLAANPAPLANRLETTRQALAVAQAAADTASKSLAPLQAAIATQAAAQDKATQAYNAVSATAAQLKAAGDAAEKLVQTRVAEQKAATDAAATAAVLAAKANADKLAAEKAVPEKVAAEKASANVARRRESSRRRRVGPKSRAGQGGRRVGGDAQDRR